MKYFAVNNICCALVSGQHGGAGISLEQAASVFHDHLEDDTNQNPVASASSFNNNPHILPSAFPKCNTFYNDAQANHGHACQVINAHGKVVININNNGTSNVAHESTSSEDNEYEIIESSAPQ